MHPERIPVPKMLFNLFKKAGALSPCMCVATMEECKEYLKKEAQTNDAETVGPCSAKGQEIDSGENVPRTQNSSDKKNSTTDSEDDTEE
jgi:hypothetical protein